MNSIARITLLLLTCLIGSATAANCNVCNNNSHKIYNKNLVHTLQNDRLGHGGQRNWSCKQLEDTADSGGFDNTQCGHAQQIATRYCGCGQHSAPVVETNGVCSFCAGKSYNADKFVNTFMGARALTCGELIDGGKNQFWPEVVCGKFKNENNAEAQCCPGTIAAAPSIGLIGCFSGDNTVNVKDKGQVHMDQVEVGDMIAVNGNNKFTRVYSFGHRDTDTMTEYVQIAANQLNKPLELTKEHMLFVENAGAVPASMVSVGDKIVLTDGATASITKISTVSRKGAYAPFTETGTLLVSDVLASSFISVIEDSASLTVGGVELASLHWLAHAFEAPHRLVCKISPSVCESETYTSEGISHWVNAPFKASMWLVNQNAVVQAALSLGVVFVCATLNLLEYMLTSCTAALVCLLAWIMSRRQTSSKQSS